MSLRTSSRRLGYGPIVSVGATAHEPLATAVGDGVGVAAVGSSVAVGDEEQPATTAAPMAPIAPSASRRLRSFTIFISRPPVSGPRLGDARPRIAARPSNARATRRGTKASTRSKGLGPRGGALARAALAGDCPPSRAAPSPGGDGEGWREDLKIR